MLTVTDQDQRILGGREVSIPAHQRNRYAHLYTLQTDLDLILLEVIEGSGDLPRRYFTLATVDYRLTEQEAITPLFDTLKALDQHIEANMKDIVQDYLFGFVEEDVQLAQVSG